MPNLPGLAPINDPSITGTALQGGRVVPRDTAPDPQRLTPVATPVDTYVRAMAPPQDNALTRLASSLASFNPALERYADVNAQMQHEDLPGKVMAAKLGSANDAEFAQKLQSDPELQSRFAQRLGQKQLGLSNADASVNQMMQDYQSGGFDKAGGNLDAWAAGYARKDLEAHKADPSYAAGYADRFETAKASLRHDLTTYRTTQAVDQQNQNIFGAALATVNAGADVSGDPSKTVRDIQEQFKTNAVVLSKSPEEQAKLQIDLLANLQAKIADDPKRAPYLSKVIEGLAMADRTSLDGKSMGSLLDNPATGGRTADILRTARGAFVKQDELANNGAMSDLAIAAHAADPSFEQKLATIQAEHPKWYSADEITTLRVQWARANTHRQAALGRQQGEIAEANAKTSLTNQGLALAAGGKLHMLKPETVLNAQGKETVVSRDDQIKAVTQARMDQIDSWALQHPGSDAQVFAAKADFFAKNPVATNDEWKSTVTAGPAAATAAVAAGGGQVPQVLHDGYQLYRKLAAISPALTQAHSDQESRTFYERARVAQDVLKMDEGSALALAARGQTDAMKGVKSPEIKPADFQSQAKSALGNWIGTDNADSVNHQEVYNDLRQAAQNLVDGNHLSWKDAIAQAAPMVKNNYTVINGVSVRTADKRLPQDFGDVANRYFDQWYAAHKDEVDMLHLDRSELSLAAVGTGATWRIVRSPMMADPDIPNASISLNQIYLMEHELQAQRDAAGKEAMAKAGAEGQASFFDRTEQLRAQVEAGHAMVIGGLSPRLLTRGSAREELSQMMANPNYAAGKAVREQQKADAETQRQTATTDAVSVDPMGSVTGTGPTSSPEPRNGFLNSYAASGAAADAISGLKDTLHGRLTHLFAAAPPDIRRQLKIDSGYRSSATQSALLKEAVGKYGSEDAAQKWAVAPGQSQHNAGKAVDLGFGSPAALKWVHENAGLFGLHFPDDNEPEHVEAIGRQDP